MANDKMNTFKTEVQRKINVLLEEFAQGKLNREQFHAIYERYNGQLELVEKAMSGADIKLSEQEGGTIMIREKFMGKARGLIIFANDTGKIIETLGLFGVAMTEITPVLEKFRKEMKAGHVVERVVHQVKEKEWLLFLCGQYTTIVTLFENEPSRYQTIVIQRMHTEFENANSTFISTGNIDSTKLVFPFYSFVQRSMGAKGV